MNRKLLASIIILSTAVSLAALSTVLVIPVTAQTNPSNNVPELPEQETILTDTVVNATDTSIDETPPPVDNNNPKPHSVSFNLENGSVECPNGDTLTGVQSHAHTRGFKEFIYSSELVPLYTASLSKHHASSSSDAYFKIIWGEVNATSNSYHLIGYLADKYASVCPQPHSVHFGVEIMGTCNGSIFSLTTDDVNGYSITASGDGVTAVCIHPDQ